MNELLWSLNGHPSICHAEYRRRYPEWQLMRDCVEGQTAIHDRGETYLPKKSTMDEQDFRVYLYSASFFNATGQTIRDLMARTFRRPPVINVPSGMDVDKLAKDGRSFRRLMRDCTKEVVTVNRVGYLLDLPKSRQAKPEPFVVQYMAEDILSWGPSASNPSWYLLRENKPKDTKDPIKANAAANIFGGELLERGRLLALDEKGDYFQWEGPIAEFEKMKELPTEGRIYPDVREVRLKYIPFFIFSSDGDEVPPLKPLILDVAHKNMSHYRNSARLAHARHFVGSPIYVAKYGDGPATTDDDESDDALSLSSDRLWEMGKEDDAKILQFQGNGLETLENALDEDEQQMRVLGARLLMQSKRTAARSSASDDNESDSHEATLQDVVESVSRGWEAIVKEACLWRGATGTVLIQLNRQFLARRLGPRELRAVDEAMGRSIPVSAVYYILRETGWIEEDMTLEEYEKEVADYLSMTNDKLTDVTKQNALPAPEKKPAKSPTAQEGVQ